MFNQVYGHQAVVGAAAIRNNADEKKCRRKFHLKGPFKGRQFVEADTIYKIYAEGGTLLYERSGLN
jgi:hypothetical protein